MNKDLRGLTFLAFAKEGFSKFDNGDNSFEIQKLQFKLSFGIMNEFNKII